MRKLSFGRKLEPEELAFTQAVHAVVLREKELSYEEVVREYRRVEAEFVERAGDDAWDVLETKRRIAEWLLGYVDRAEQPMPVCRAYWHELLELGFSSIEMKYAQCGIYARICQWRAEFDEGIAVLDPCIAEIEQALQDPNLTPQARRYYTYEHKVLTIIRSELEAGVQSGPPIDIELPLLEGETID